MFGVTISAPGRKARSCENTGPRQQKKSKRSYINLECVAARRDATKWVHVGAASCSWSAVKEVTSPRISILYPRTINLVFMHWRHCVEEVFLIPQLLPILLYYLFIHLSLESLAGWLVRRRQFSGARACVSGALLNSVAHRESVAVMRRKCSRWSQSSWSVLRKNISSNCRNAPFVCTETPQ